MSAAYDIRPFETIEELRECVALQEETWGEGFSERVSPAILKVSQLLGGVAAGAYDASGSLVGFVFGMTGLRDGEVVHWSDMLAVRESARDTGLGTKLKAYQRGQVMGLGIEKMFWTFDPLRARNAYLNLNKLGAVVREYAENMYGDSDSPLHSGIGTDRFIALWLLSSERVRARIDDGEASARARVAPRASGAGRLDPGVDHPPIHEGDTLLALDARIGPDHPEPLDPDLAWRGDRIAVKIPSDIAAVMADDLELARAWRRATRSAFTSYLSAGYEVRGFQRGAETSAYLLGPVGTEW